MVIASAAELGAAEPPGGLREVDGIAVLVLGEFELLRRDEGVERLLVVAPHPARHLEIDALEGDRDVVFLENARLQHFELQLPSGSPRSSGNTRNYPGSGNAVAFAVPVVYGYYCATAWKWNGGSSYTKLGYLCFIAGS